MKSTKMESGLVQLYDGLVAPIMKVVEGLVSPPIGKSIILVGEKIR